MCLDRYVEGNNVNICGKERMEEGLWGGPLGSEGPAERKNKNKNTKKKKKKKKKNNNKKNKKKNKKKKKKKKEEEDDKPHLYLPYLSHCFSRFVFIPWYEGKAQVQYTYVN